MLESYSAARRRHAAVRLEVYSSVRHDAITAGGLPPQLRLADIDRDAMDAWRCSWAGRCHAGGTGGWNWPALLDRMPRRAAVLPVAIWHGPDLCGLALGHASRARAWHVRHTMTLTFVERRPSPPEVPLRGHVVRLAVAAARSYGAAWRARRLVLRAPDPNLVGYYEKLGFGVAWKGRTPV